MDAIARLIAAIAEARARMGGGGRRAPGKNKKVKAVARVAGKGGPSVGCGTGKGGFKAGNQCAKEDGIPQRPLGQGGGLKKADAKADLALAKKLREKAAARKARKEALDRKKSEATKAQREKQRRINRLRSEAAKRRAEKDQRDAAEKQSAKDAADQKRASMLQRIRIKKASERLEVIEKPPSIFSGKGDNVTKQVGETEVEFVKRKYKQDLDKLHSESEKIEFDYAAQVKKAESERNAATARINDVGQRLYGSQEKPKGKELADLLEEDKRLRKQLADKSKEVSDLQKERDAKVHKLVGEFTTAHAGKTMSASSDPKDYDIVDTGFMSQQAKDGVREGAQKAWAWFSGVAAPAHSGAIAGTKIRPRQAGGGSHSMDTNEATIGFGGSAESAAKVAVHEYGHAIESKRPATMKAVAEDYERRRDDFMLANKGSKIMGTDACSYYECVYGPGEQRQNLALEAPSLLGYARRYSDCQYDAATRQRFSNNSTGRFSGGTEVFSTGVESVYREPTDFRKRARHGFDLTVLILAGLL